MRRAVVAALCAVAATGLVLPRPPRSALRTRRHEVARAIATDGGATSQPPPLLRGKSPVEAVWAVAWPSVAIGLLRTALGQTDAWYVGRLGAAERAAAPTSSHRGAAAATHRGAAAATIFRGRVATPPRGDTGIF